MRVLAGVLLVCFAGCQKMKPEAITLPDYPDLEKLIIQQADLLDKKNVEKNVSLDGEIEHHLLTLDSAQWLQELSFLKEINPNQPRNVGIFEKSTAGNNTTLTLKSGESSPIKKCSYTIENRVYRDISAIFHEKKDIYDHYREVQLDFKDGILKNFQVDGYQKMLFKDTIQFGFDISVLD